MNSNVTNLGLTMQKILSNIPRNISVNSTTTSVTMDSGKVYQAGLISNSIQAEFREVDFNPSIIGKVVDAELTEDGLYILNKEGYVFRYVYNAGACSPVVTEVFCPNVCDGDRAIKIATGRKHCVILTERHRVYGAGCNGEYQLVPQGQCRYDTAVEIIITDTNVHDNRFPCGFLGTLNEAKCPEVEPCSEPLCIMGPTNKHHQIGYLTIIPINLSSNRSSCEAVTGVLKIPVFLDLQYSGFVCQNNDKYVATITYTINCVYINEGCFDGKFIVDGGHECKFLEKKLSLVSTSRLVIADSENNSNFPLVKTVQKCYSKEEKNIVFSVDLSSVVLPDISNGSTGLVLSIPHSDETTTISAENALLSKQSDVAVSLDNTNVVHHGICKKTSCTVQKTKECWQDIFAGYNTTVLLDKCGRLFVLGSIWQIRNNKELLQRNCLEELLDKTNASIHFPADQLNCCVKPRNDNCECFKCRQKCFKTDINKFGININFPGGEDECGRRLNLCDFLNRLQKCNEKPLCANTCVPCEGWIYLDATIMVKPDDCECLAVSGYPLIRSITLLNRKSVAKSVTSGADICTIDVNLESTVEFDLNKYCIDSEDFCLEKIIVLRFNQNGKLDVTVYVDIDNNGGIKFIPPERVHNVIFEVDKSRKNSKFILNYGGIMDPVELANLKQLLVNCCIFPSPLYGNNVCKKVINTYLRGGDIVRFIDQTGGSRKQTITADIPTVFSLGSKVVDVGVGNNNLSVLITSLGCGNEILAIGNNCFGELGINSNETTVNWKKVNKCYFDCQVVAIFSGKTLTAYITQSRSVYTSGQWRCRYNSNIPTVDEDICPAWRTKEIAISENQIVLLGDEGCVHGFGDNRLGELGLCHRDCVESPILLTFFQHLNYDLASGLNRVINHPIVNRLKRTTRCLKCQKDYNWCECEKDMYNAKNRVYNNRLVERGPFGRRSGFW